MISKLEDKLIQCPSQCTCCSKPIDSEVKAKPFSTPRVPQAKPKQTLKKSTTRRKQPALSEKVKPKLQEAKKPSPTKKLVVSKEGKARSPAVKKLGDTKKPVVSNKVKPSPRIKKPNTTKKAVVSPNTLGNTVKPKTV